MRVLTFLHSLEAGGVERDILRFNKTWQDAGIEVLVALGRREGALESEVPPDVPIRQLQTGTVSTRHWESLWMIAKLPRVVREWRPDVVFCAGNSYTIVAFMLRLILGAACPPIVVRISNDLARPDMPPVFRAAYHWWLRLQAPRFAAIVAMAEPARAQIVELMRADPARAVTINNASMLAADADRLAAARDATPRAHKGRHYLAVGRLAPQKNFAMLLGAFAAIAQPDDRLTIIGEGEERAMLESRAAALGIADRVAMPGHLNPIDAYYASADVFVLSSDYEGLAAVLVEALAAGLPIVATDCSPNLAMLVEDAGILVPPGDQAALATAMRDIPTGAFDIALMRRRARSFTAEANTRKWFTLFERLAG